MFWFDVECIWISFFSLMVNAHQHWPHPVGLSFFIPQDFLIDHCQKLGILLLVPNLARPQVLQRLEALLHLVAKGHEFRGQIPRVVQRGKRNGITTTFSCFFQSIIHLAGQQPWQETVTNLEGWNTVRIPRLHSLRHGSMFEFWIQHVLWTWTFG